MRKIVILVTLLIAGCKDYQSNPYVPMSRDYKPRNAHEDLSQQLYYGDADFSSSLNSFMSGPTSQTFFTRADVQSSNCSDVYDFSNVGGSDEAMNGFPLTMADDNAGSIKGEPQILWDECQGIESNYDDGAQSSSCKRRKMSKEFFGFFDKSFGKCVQAAAKGFGQSGDAEVEAIKFSHAGISGDTRHSNRSYHSVNRAIDIRTIAFKQGDKVVRLKVSDQKKSPSKEFFEQFRKCWHEQIVSYKSNCPGNEPKGSIGHEDHNHQHHLHLSLPYCPRTFKGSRYYVK
ncbi:hypothetical protein [Halobacteriovorax marinus]|uniref:hypothetical protein n=1 Tax=Halobacteriovorax marinus TaxID=97084 RepID=UPI003A95CDC7